MRSPDSATTRLDDYIVDMLPWAHGHQRKAIRDFVQAIIDQQTGCQAQLARSFGNQEAAAKRLARLLHNERLEPRHLADAVLLQALVQLPAHGPAVSVNLLYGFGRFNLQNAAIHAFAGRAAHVEAPPSGDNVACAILYGPAPAS